MPSHYYRGQISPSTPTDEEASRVDNNNTPDSASRVLRGLFRSREGQGNNILENRMSDSLSSIQQEHRQRTTPLMADTLMSGSTLLCRDDFVNRRSAWNPNSLFEHL